MSKNKKKSIKIGQNIKNTWLNLIKLVILYIKGQFSERIVNKSAESWYLGSRRCLRITPVPNYNRRKETY